MLHFSTATCFTFRPPRTSVTKTFSLALAKIEERNPTAADLVRATAFLASDAIPEQIFIEGKAHLGSKLAELPSESITFLLATAVRFGIVHRDLTNKAINVHRLVQEVIKDGMDEDTTKVKIIVLNVNQAPEIIDFSDNLIALKDEPTLFEVNAVDGDGDELTYKWKFGFFDEYEDGNQHHRIFTTTGSKKAEVFVSDVIHSAK